MMLPALQPVELRTERPMELRDGQYSTTTDVWRMLSAAREGDLAAVEELAGAQPGLARCEHNYLPPLHLAVREGHEDVVRFLLERGAFDPRYETYPYREKIETIAEDRGYETIALLLGEERVAGRSRPKETQLHGPGHIDFSADPRQAVRDALERLLDSDDLNGVEAMLGEQPDLIQDPLLFWAEGILASPCNGRRQGLIELLLRMGARVPDIAKWGPFYYFKHAGIAALLLERGMNPDHMNWQRITLLHEMARMGEAEKLTLLLDHGANIDALDDEFRSTPLGHAARWGRLEVVRILLDRGADPNKAGAEWATPLLWAQKGGHPKIASDLKAAGARS